MGLTQYDSTQATVNQSQTWRTSCQIGSHYWGCHWLFNPDSIKAPIPLRLAYIFSLPSYCCSEREKVEVMMREVILMGDLIVFMARHQAPVTGHWASGCRGGARERQSRGTTAERCYSYRMWQFPFANIIPPKGGLTGCWVLICSEIWQWDYIMIFVLIYIYTISIYILSKKHKTIGIWQKSLSQISLKQTFWKMSWVYCT